MTTGDNMQLNLLNRREFIKYSSLSIIAFSFGCSISRLIDDSSEKVALIYATKYGSTKDTSHWIKDGMKGSIDLLDIESISFSDTSSGYDRFIIGSGVWIGGVHNRLLDFLASQKDRLSGKVAASFIVCGTDGSTPDGRKRIDGYIEELHSSLSSRPALSRSFGGRIIVEQLTEEDREALTVFYRRFFQKELTSWDRTDPEKAVFFGDELYSYLTEKEVKRRV